MCLNMSEFTIIDTVLNMYHIIHSVRSLDKLMSTLLRDTRIQNPIKDLRWSAS